MSVAISRKPGGFRFDLQSRAVTKSGEDLLSTQRARLRIEGDVANVTLSSAIVLSFCPFCGTPVHKLFTPSTLRGLSDLAERHSEYSMGVS
ncbi:hypothetical protein ABIA00_007340 [Bradyrhizobium ottawaense]|uniref:hypothetical protein n=1 Tax=Bradyrhizobium TaxID=374 RepID=UPI0012603455|nr:MULTISPECIES: hypothetical protein [Bradyrhizobium]MBR1330235.1 hypothetical protein [Bradyrhizobium ottawaense]MBR1336335.1 hypothetical protein [Bradyrhizobium ottawaense]